MTEHLGGSTPASRYGWIEISTSVGTEVHDKGVSVPTEVFYGNEPFKAALLECLPVGKLRVCLLSLGFLFLRSSRHLHCTCSGENNRGQIKVREEVDRESLPSYYCLPLPALPLPDHPSYLSLD